jgi:hypothetical protein
MRNHCPSYKTFYNVLKDILNSTKERNKGKHIPVPLSNTRSIEKGSEA